MKTDLQTLNGFFNKETQFKHVLQHIYVKIKKIDRNSEVFKWFSGEVPGLACGWSGFESHSILGLFFFLFFSDWTLIK